MATKPVRAVAILNALADPATVDTALAQRIGEAFAFTYRRGEDLTVAQKSGVFIAAIRREIERVLSEAEV